MNDDEKFMGLFGGIFFSVGIVAFIAGIVVLCLCGGFSDGGIIGGGVPLLIGLIFSAIGGGFLISLFKKKSLRKQVLTRGRRYTGKIYSYLEDKSFTMNGDFLVNTKVHYFDENQEEREVLLQTRFTKGTNDFPIGATIDIVVDGMNCTWVKDSVRYEVIPGEAELMDDKPVNPTMVHMTAITCAGCGASFSGVKGYVATCPYCGRAIEG